MTEFDMSRMQQDAVNRVREMQRRAKTSLETAKTKDTEKSERQKGSFSEKDRHSESHGVQSTPAQKKNRVMDFLKIFNFGKLEEDSDRSLILLIIILLASDDCDELLILALVYLLI